MKGNNVIVSSIIAKIITPYILLFALYIQINGEVSPGGGFQAGSILASAIIGYDSIYPQQLVRHKLAILPLSIIATLGVMIYGLTGLLALLYGKNYLNYNVITFSYDSQSLGIFIVELGVGIAVTASLLIIYYLFVINYDTNQ
ncbi:Na+/H+ antiporter family protein [Orientia chuto str. Dubai]|uniref:Na+/H+ antiporter family protein n=1 Tax=Orientia chuto str. Dubai TaxID=1359168 RepID=A0A0F3MN77_9RICK|nr:Na(+)/H(+) antiporter subunit B [Candidatus Orientia mediorientalis]KJV57101.1 Na+/H+ antiporter family protein [Orientia chuto str. Dubai]